MSHGAPSSSITYKWSYDVFLSFRRGDTFHFTKHLLDSLRRTGLRVFFAEMIMPGEDIASTLFKAMQESRIAIMIFSENYAKSEFCLDEVVHILECFKEDRLIYPVLYDVATAEVQLQTGSYAEAFTVMEKKFKYELVEKWRRAVSQAADFPGYHFHPWSMVAHDCTRVIIERVTARIEEEEHGNKIHETTNFGLWEKRTWIGSGAHGMVYVVQHRETGALRAVKELKIFPGENEESIRLEIEFFSQLEYHPNIVKYYGHKKEEGLISIYMEYIQPGSLKKYISESEGRKLDEPLIQNFTAQILSGLVHLHSNRGVHRDIKPENLLVDSENIVKLVDFGLAKLLKESVGRHSVSGTQHYAAPEVRNNKKYKNSREALAADIWSLGCVIIEMFSGCPPDSDYDSDLIPQELCQAGKDFLELCFIREPAERPSTEELLKHPFVSAQA